MAGNLNHLLLRFGLRVRLRHIKERQLQAGCLIAAFLAFLAEQLGIEQADLFPQQVILLKKTLLIALQSEDDFPQFLRVIRQCGQFSIHVRTLTYYNNNISNIIHIPRIVLTKPPHSSAACALGADRGRGEATPRLPG